MNWAPKLANALGTAAVQTVTMVSGQVQFAGTVDFSPVRMVVAGPMGFPPATANPGAVGDAGYSPLITSGNGIVLNAPHVANGTGEHDRVLSIDVVAKRVTMRIKPAFYHDKDIFYISTDASDSGVAALEEASFAPNLNAAPGLGSNAPQTSARASIIPFVNGPTGPDNQLPDHGPKVIRWRGST